jgi:hypothetical protein
MSNRETGCKAIMHSITPETNLISFSEVPLPGNKAVMTAQITEAAVRERKY